MNLNDYFERVVMITLPGRDSGRERILRQLKEQEIECNLEVFTAVHGDSVGVPAWWKCGGGAFGCLMSHARVVEEAVRDDIDSVLILEDDAIIAPRFQVHLEEFWEVLPDNWDQIYLGGQHLDRPIRLGPKLLRPLDVNRTHAYALKKSCYKQFHAHILHAPDYISRFNHDERPHVDHQLGRAHRRQDWNVYTPNEWMMGQGENYSWINARWHPDKWWDYPHGDSFLFLPYIIVERDGLFKEVRGEHWRGRRSKTWGVGRREEPAKYLHFGWELGPNELSTKEGWENWDDPGMIHKPVRTVAKEAFDCRRLPAFHGSDKQVDFVRRCWPGGTTTLAEIKEYGDIKEVLKGMSDYPWNGLLKQHTEAFDTV